LAARGHYRSASFPVTRFVLFSSRASIGGGPYIAEEIYPLTRQSADGREAGIML
ncbi:MAG: RNA 2',3'-cyclic phosphodiesterase, partial [Xanthobacteraceae bacterium]